MKYHWIICFSLSVSSVLAVNTETLPQVGTRSTVGKVGGLTIEAAVQGPALEETPLQVACLFEYVEGDIFTSPPALPKELNGMRHLDEALNGLITTLRKTNKFTGKSLETLTIIPPPNTIAAKKLVLIGLGPRNDFTPEMMRMVGVVGMREAINAGVASYSHASDLKDAGIDSPTAAVAGFVVEGALRAYETACYLRKENAADTLSVSKITLLTGPAYFADSKEGIKKMLGSLRVPQ